MNASRAAANAGPSPVVRSPAPPAAGSASARCTASRHRERGRTSPRGIATPRCQRQPPALRCGPARETPRESPDVLCAERRTSQQAQELLTGFDRHPQARDRARLGVHHLALDERFQRHLLRIEFHRPCRAALRHVARQLGALGAQSRGNRRAVVVPLQLTELPLPREQPEGIVDPRLQRFGLGSAANVGFQPRPGGDGWHRLRVSL